MPEIKANKKSRESQRSIYKGLRRLLLKKDLCDITVQEISDECNISRSTFYRNFDNVIDVIEVMFDYFYNRYLEHRKTKINQLSRCLLAYVYNTQFYSNVYPKKCQLKKRAFHFKRLRFIGFLFYKNL